MIGSAHTDAIISGHRGALGARMAQAEELVEHDRQAVDVAARVDRRCPAACSGDMYAGVPDERAGLRLEHARRRGAARAVAAPPAAPPRRCRSLRPCARPQSITTTSPSDPTMTLAGFRSRCRIPCSCACCTPRRISLQICRRYSGEYLRQVRGVAGAQLADDRLERLALDVLHDEEVLPCPRRRRRRGWARCWDARAARRCASPRRSARRRRRRCLSGRSRLSATRDRCRGRASASPAPDRPRRAAAPPRSAARPSTTTREVPSAAATTRGNTVERPPAKLRAPTVAVEEEAATVASKARGGFTRVRSGSFIGAPGRCTNKGVDPLALRAGRSRSLADARSSAPPSTTY